MSLKGILNFKQALSFTDLPYPFSTTFGLANSRDNCVQSAKEIYKILRGGSTEADNLTFETLCVIAMDPESTEINEAILKDLVTIFRPERDGTVGSVRFIRSIDRVYKDMRLLRASIRNSSQIHQSFEA